MTDREKVIKGLEIHTKQNSRCVGCPYPNNGLCGDQLYVDALALLKEPEAVKPDTDSEGTCSCGNCGETVGWFPDGCSTPKKLCKFCPECGRAVKWE